jgi:hypothetical protein
VLGLQRRDNGSAHFAGGYRGPARLADVSRARAGVQSCVHRALQQRGVVRPRQRQPQHHGDAEYRPERIGDALPRDIGRAAVHRFVERCAPAGLIDRAQRRRGQHAERARCHCRAIGQDVAENIVGDDDVELRRRPYQLHRAIVDIQVAQCDVGKFGVAQGLHFLAPQHSRLHHVRLVDRAHLAAARARELEGEPCDAADFGRSIGLRIEAAPLAVGQGFDAARLAEIDAADEFTHDDEIHALEQAVLQRRRLIQRRDRDDRPQIGEQFERAAYVRQAAGDARFPRNCIAIHSAHGAEQNGVRRAHRVLGRLGQYLTEPAIGVGAVRKFF